MKYLMAILIPPMAVIGCGMVLSGIVNAVFWAGAIVLLLSSLVWFFILATPVALLLSASLALWVVASAHAVFVLRSNAEARSMEEEEALLGQQMELMRQAAVSRAPAREGGRNERGAPVESKSRVGSPALQVAGIESPTLEKIVRDECWLEGERRGCEVNPDDPVVSARIAEIIRASDHAILPQKLEL